MLSKLHIQLHSNRITSLFLYRDSDPSRYEIEADLSLEKPGSVGPPFNFTFQVSHQAQMSIRKSLTM